MYSTFGNWTPNVETSKQDKLVMQIATLIDSIHLLGFWKKQMTITNGSLQYIQFQEVLTSL